MMIICVISANTQNWSPSSPDIRPLKIGPPRPLENSRAKIPLTGSHYPEDYKPSSADVYRVGW